MPRPDYEKLASTRDERKDRDFFEVRVTAYGPSGSHSLYMGDWVPEASLALSDREFIDRCCDRFRDELLARFAREVA